MRRRLKQACASSEQDVRGLEGHGVQVVVSEERPCSDEARGKVTEDVVVIGGDVVR